MVKWIFSAIINAVTSTSVYNINTPYLIDNDIKNETIEKENKTMEKVLKVDGMMCMHCEATVKKALEEIDGVAAAYPDHKKKEVRVELDKDVADDILEKAITDKGYTII